MAQRFCPACGTDVEVGVILTAGAEVPVCEQCGLMLEQPGGSSPSAQAGALQNVIIAEDSQLLREVLADLFVSEGVAQNVTQCPDGEVFLEAATRTYHQSGKIDLVTLDANMPIVDGYRAALALRAIERGFGVQTPAPILFFTSVPCDDTFRKVMERVAPSKYVNKESAPSPKELVSRIRLILSAGQ